MRSATLALFAALTVTMLVPLGASAQEPAPPDELALETAGVRDIIVKRVPGLSRGERTELRENADVARVSDLRLTRAEVVRVEPGQLDEALEQLRSDPDVEWAEPDAPVRALTNDTYFRQLWGLHNTGQTVSNVSGTADADIDAPEAWALSTGSGETVGVVDSGVAQSHQDLTSRLATNPGEYGAGKQSNGVDDDANGYVDDWQGWDWVNCRNSACATEGDSAPGPDNNPQDFHGHGTHVAGTIAAAANNASGVAGVAYNAKVLPMRALGSDGRGSFASTASAYDYAGDLGLRVVNVSIGSGYRSQAEYEAIAAHPNTLYVVAAGNDSADVDGAGAFPCGLELTNIICVGATDSNDQPATFSNFGGVSVDLFAPGQAVLSSYADPARPYAYMNGTSMAAPHVAGVAALMRSANRSLTAAQLKALLLATADRKLALLGRSVTGGRVNAAAAVRAAAVLQDRDLDGVDDNQDNCPYAPNPGQADADADGVGDACDATPPVPPSPTRTPAAADGDADGIADAADNCPSVKNPSQEDSDGDGDGDACEPTPAPSGDIDADGVTDATDNCLTTANASQVDNDADGRGDACDTQPGPTPQRDNAQTSGANAPELSRVAMTRRTLRGRRSARFRYVLDRPAAVTAQAKRRVCPRHRRCRYVTVATRHVEGRSGSNAFSVNRRFGGVRLRAGRYRLVVRAAVNGQKSRAVTVNFRVRR